MTKPMIPAENKAIVDNILKRNARMFCSLGKSSTKKEIKRAKALEKRSFRYFRHYAPELFDFLLKASD